MHELSHVYFVVVFILVRGLAPGSDLLVCLYLAINWLLLAITIISA